MAIYGINQHGSDVYIKSIKDSQKPETVNGSSAMNESDSISDGGNSMPGASDNSRNEKNNTSRVSDPKEIFEFNKSGSFDLTKEAAPLDQEDIDKAIDDMKKEVILEQYTYFVEPANLGTDADGTVRIKN